MSKEKKRKAILALENGSIYEGSSCGIEGERTGGVSFYTGVVGYQEVITAPSNAGKIVVMTYPLIGNYGVAKKFWESGQCWAEGLIIKEMSRITSNWQAEDDFADYLQDEKVLAIEAVDTRALMVELRQCGEQFGIISTRDFIPKSLKRKIEQAKKEEFDFIKSISNKKIVELSGGIGKYTLIPLRAQAGTSKTFLMVRLRSPLVPSEVEGLTTENHPRVIAKRFSCNGKAVGIIDIGVTNSLINQLNQLGCKLTIIPYQASSDDIARLSLKALIIADGPEMDKQIIAVVNTIKQLFGKLPIFGLGTGCQILALALGAQIKRMHLGHHGVNYPVVKPGSLKGEITQQNHGCVIDEASLKGKDIEITWRNLNDQSIEGIQNSKLNAFGCQFYPASPGLGEVNPILEEFIIGIKN